MNGLGLTRRLSLVIGLVAAALLVAVLVLAISIRELDQASDAARQAEQTATSAERVKTLVLDAETGVRGFAITGRDVFLEPLLSAELNLPENTAALTNARLPNARAHALAEAIATNSSDYINEYATPLVSSLRTDPKAGRDSIISGSGKRRVDQLRDELNELTGIVRRDAAATADDARDHASRAQTLAIGAGIFALLLFVGLIAYLTRTIVTPIKKTADAATALGSGDLSVRVEPTGRDEVGQLADAFNAMGESLAANAAEIEAQQVELENQNAELEQQAVELESQAVEMEAQTAELEAGQHELAESNEMLVHRTQELEETAAALEAAHARTQLFAQVADELGRLGGLTERAEVVLACTADMLGAEVGAIYAYTGVDSTVPHLVAHRGIAVDDLPIQADGLHGLAGRALQEDRTLTGVRGDGDLLLNAFGKPVPVRRELHVPLRYGDRVVGVLSAGRALDEPFGPGEIAAAEHLGEQAAVAFDNAIESDRRRWLADVQRAVLDTTGDAIRLVTPNGELVINNPEMQRFEKEVFQSDPLESFDDMEKMSDRIAERTADPVAYRARLATIIGDPEGEYTDEYELVDTHRWVHRFTAPVRTEEGDLVGRIFVLRETTEQRRAEALKDELMSTVSHELRTPLSAILGFAELLQARDYEKAERDEYLGTIHQQATRLSSLISDFLDIQRLEQSDEDLRMGKVELSGVLKQQVEFFSRQSADHPVLFESEAAAEALVVEGDEDHLRRAVANLISNAIKYSPAGGPVTVEASRRNGDVVVAVRDEGLGIPADAQRRVFDRFYRVDTAKTRKIGGTGLGLALVREIARAHGGDVGVESVEGHGSRFWIKVPVTHEHPAAD